MKCVLIRTHVLCVCYHVWCFDNIDMSHWRQGKKQFIFLKSGISYNVAGTIALFCLLEVNIVCTSSEWLKLHIQIIYLPRDYGQLYYDKDLWKFLTSFSESCQSNYVIFIYSCEKFVFKLFSLIVALFNVILLNFFNCL